MKFNKLHYNINDLVFRTESSSQHPTEIECFRLNPTEASMEHLNMDFFGEAPISFRALLKRYVYSEAIATASSSTGSVRYTSITGPIIPINGMPYGSASRLNDNLFTYLYYAYLGFRGGVRHMYMSYGISTYVSQYASLSPPSTSTAALATSVVTADPKLSLEGSIAIAINTPTMEVEYPFYSSNSFHIAFSDTNMITTSGDSMSDFWFRNYSLQLAPSSGGAIGVGSVVTSVAAAEDFSFMRFQGAPFYSGAPVV